MLGHRTPMSFPLPILLFLLSALALLPAAVSGGHDPDRLELQLLHRHHPDVSSKLHDTDPPESLIDRLRDLHDQDHKRHKLISLTLQRERDESPRRSDLQTDERKSAVRLKMNAGADYGVGQYFVHVQVGTPPQKFMLIADTASELTWMKCRYRRCTGKNCSAIHRKKLHPAEKFPNPFLANRSSTFKTVDCSSEMCKSSFSKLFSRTECPTPTSPCLYDYSYLDGLSALGIFANETITVGLTNGKSAHLLNAVIGCTESLQGRAFSGADGVMGLSYSNFSFTLKTADVSGGGGFSYCLVDHLSVRNATNYFVFGAPAASPASKNLMTFTELRLGGLYGSFYGVDMTGISVNGEMLKIPPEVWDIKAEGGAIIDSGTSLTMLTEPAFDAVMEAVTAPLSKFERKTLAPFDFCFNSTEYKESMAPKLSFHFGSGAVFTPPAKSFIIAAAPETSCIGFVVLESPASNIIGNILQQNHLWQFDFVRRKVGFAPSSCL